MFKVVLIVMGVTSWGDTQTLQRIDEPDLATCASHVRQKEFTDFPSKDFIAVGYMCVQEREV